MSENSWLRLPPILLKTIEKNRGNLTHEEFIQVCVEAWLACHKALPEKPSTEFYVMRDEFEEFKTGIRDLLRSSLSFLMHYWMELSPQMSETKMLLRGRLLNTIASNS